MVVVAFSDWLRDIFTTSAAEKAAADRARASATKAGSWANKRMTTAVTPRSQQRHLAAYEPERPRKVPDKGEQTNMLAGSSVLTNKRVYRGSSPRPRAAQPDASFYDRTIGAIRENPARLQFTQEAEPGRRGSLRNETITYAPRPAEKNYGPSDDSFYGRTVGAVLKNPPIPTFSGDTRGRTVNRGKALDDLAALDAKTRDRVDQEFAAEGRKQTLATERPLTDAEYAALSPRQQAAILFNTGLIDAGRADEAAGGGIDATKEYLSRFGISPKGDDLTSFLRLDDLISDSILQKLDDLTARQDSASSLRWARGDEKAAGDSARFLRARGSSDAAAEAISLNLSSTGNPLLSGGTPLAGFGSTDRDNVVKFAFTNMVDSRWNMTWDDVVSGLNQLNTNFGTDVSPEELWQYAGAAVSSVDFARAGSREADVYNMTTPDPEDKDFTPIDAAEIRRRYGL